MEAYSIKIEVFEGPMALLMHLIEKDKLDINDIPIAKITEQYMAYLRAMEEFNIEVASEFLVMAATLLQIKSRLLLPKPPIIDAAAEDDYDPRQELVQRLVEYRKFKEMASHLEVMATTRQLYYNRAPQVFNNQVILTGNLSINDLVSAFASLLQSKEVDYTLIKYDDFSVQDKLNDIINLLVKNGGRLEFEQTFIRSGSHSEMIASFLAVLELIKVQKIAILQKQSFGPIYLILKGEAA